MKYSCEDTEVCPPRILIVNDQFVKSNEGSSTAHSSTAVDKDWSSGVRVEFLHLVDQVQQDLKMTPPDDLILPALPYLCIIWSSHVWPAVTLELLYHTICHRVCRKMECPVDVSAWVGFSLGLDLWQIMMKKVTRCVSCSP